MFWMMVQYWRNVGDQRSNAGPIEASADEINPLVERIVNGMEAVIELRVAESGEQPPEPTCCNRVPIRHTAWGIPAS